MPRLEAIAAAAILSSSGAAAEAAARRPIDLPAGRLGDAVVALGRQAGVSIGVADPALAAERVPAVRGTMTVEQALRRLLAGRGAAWVAVDSQTFRIVRRPQSPSPPPPASRPAPAPAPARSAAPQPPEAPATEIVVTAAKRPVRAAAFAGTVDIVAGDELTPELGLRGSEALTARLPALTSTHFGPGRNKLFIRGIADSSFNGPTQATVGQYLGETRLTYNAPDPDLRLYDIQRVEVLAGPQGTLYGAGSLGGIVRIVPNPPRPAETEGHVALGAFQTWHGDPGADAAGMLNLPLAGGRAALRIVGWSAIEGGYIDDVRRGLSDVNRVRIHGGRVAGRIEADGGWTVDLGLVGQSISGEDAQYALREAPPLTRRSPVRENFGNDYALADLVVARAWNDLRFVAAAGAVRHRLRERFDATRGDGPTALVDQATRVSLLSFESRLARGGAGDSGWLLGASVVRNDAVRIIAPPPVELPGDRQRLENDTFETALFGEATVRVTSWLNATAGGRLVHSHVSGAADPVFHIPGTPPPPTRGSRSERILLPSAALTARAGRDLLFFARYQEGFRLGGLGLRGTGIHLFRSDDVAAAEAGLRYGRPGTGRFDAALAFAYTRWRNVQADLVDIGGRVISINVGDGRIHTADLRFGWRPVEGLELEAGAVWNDSLVTDTRPNIIIAPRSPLPNVADLNARLGARYRAELAGWSVSWSGAARYVGRSRIGFGGILGEAQGEWLDVSLAARAESGRRAFSFGISNLFDAQGNRFALGSPYSVSGQRQITPLRPRTVRLGWELAF